VETLMGIFWPGCSGGARGGEARGGARGTRRHAKAREGTRAKRTEGDESMKPCVCVYINMVGLC
jgi:hypothetical protein